jgi:hypothetical protein
MLPHNESSLAYKCLVQALDSSSETGEAPQTAPELSTGRAKTEGRKSQVFKLVPPHFSQARSGTAYRCGSAASQLWHSDMQLAADRIIDMHAVGCLHSQRTSRSLWLDGRSENRHFTAARRGQMISSNFDNSMSFISYSSSTSLLAFHSHVQSPWQQVSHVSNAHGIQHSQAERPGATVFGSCDNLLSRDGRRSTGRK